MVTRSLGVTLRPLSAAYRAKARTLYRERAKGRLFDRALLEDCLFEIQNDLEHRSPKHPQVGILTSCRNLLLADIGETEGELVNRTRIARGDTANGRTHYSDGRPILLRWPADEKIAAIMAEKRRPAPRCAPPPAVRRAMGVGNP